MNVSALAAWDKKHLWHPFTQQADWAKEEPMIVRSAKGLYLRDAHGKRYLDGVSSLWVNVHGHGHPALDAAIRRQLSQMAHTTFLGLTHEPAIRLGRELASIAPRGLGRVFYSDNGATAVEVALKMAYQYWVQAAAAPSDKPGPRPSARGRPPRTEFLALANSYHGDTLGAVSVGGIAAFHKKFKPLLFRSHFAASPDCAACPHRRLPHAGTLRTGTERVPPAAVPGRPRRETGCRWECLGDAERILRARGGKLAAAVVEPVVQGAAGMKVMPPGYLRGFARLCRRYGVPLIADEVATGFGRTGRMFAVENEGVTPDFLCLAKSITGGTLPLAATLTRERIFRAFLGRYEEFKTFFHGHSYTANPLACAAALASVRLFGQENTLGRLRPKTRLLRRWLEGLRGNPHVADVRQAGFMAGVQLCRRDGRPFDPADKAGQRVCRAARRRGVWIRPLGDTLVVMPPLATPLPTLRKLLDGVARSIEEALN
jgi:adenosylmethionine---8-amino-7-oxononanoate aminotransferase